MLISLRHWFIWKLDNDDQNKFHDIKNAFILDKIFNESYKCGGFNGKMPIFDRFRSGKNRWKSINIGMLLLKVISFCCYRNKCNVIFNGRFIEGNNESFKGWKLHHPESWICFELSFSIDWFFQNLLWFHLSFLFQHEIRFFFLVSLWYILESLWPPTDHPFSCPRLFCEINLGTLMLILYDLWYILMASQNGIRFLALPW